MTPQGWKFYRISTSMEVLSSVCWLDSAAREGHDDYKTTFIRRYTDHIVWWRSYLWKIIATFWMLCCLSLINVFFELVADTFDLYFDWCWRQNMLVTSSRSWWQIVDTTTKIVSTVKASMTRLYDFKHILGAILSERKDFFIFFSRPTSFAAVFPIFQH